MTNPFARAAEIVAAGPLGVDALYEFKQGGPPFPVRLILSHEEEGGGMGFGTPGKAAIRVRATITSVALNPNASPERMARPAPGDLIGIGSEGGWRVTNARMDVEGVSYTLDLARQD